MALIKTNALTASVPLIILPVVVVVVVVQEEGRTVPRVVTSTEYCEGVP